MHKTRSKAIADNMKIDSEHFDRDHSDSKQLSDDNVWEDVQDVYTIKEGSQQRTRANPSGSIRSSTPRRRRTPKTTFIATSPRKPVLAPKTTKKPAPPVISREEVITHAWDGVAFTGGYALDVVKTAIHLLRKPLAILLFLWLLAIIIGQISHILRSALAPLCILPGVSKSSFCYPTKSTTDGSKNPRWADYPQLIGVQSKSFEQLLEESVGGSGLTLEIKKAEMATSDLVTLVRVSELKSRDTLADSLMTFVEDAKKTGRGLQRLNSKIGGAVDNILAVNDYALHAIEDANVKTSSRISLQALIPWSSTKTTKEVVTETFTEAMNVLSNNMERLIIEAEINLASLNELEERLSTLHELVSREDSSLSSAKSELLAELWTILGGNKKTLRGYEKNLFLLKGLGEYRKQALVHVVAALQTLQSMSADMEDLRERVTTPGLVGSAIPVEVHMKSIRNGLERLKEGRIRAKSLGEDVRRKFLTIGPDDDNAVE